MANYTTTPQEKKTFESLWRVQKVILETLDFNEVAQKICDTILVELGYMKLGFRNIVLVLADESANGLRRIAISQTDPAKKAVDNLEVPFHSIVIPFDRKDNLCIKVFFSQRPGSTNYWPDILTPPNSPENAIKAQKASGINSSMVYPVVAKGKSLGVMIFSMVKDASAVSQEEEDLIRGYTDIVGIAVQNSQLYSQLELATNRLNKANDRLKMLDKLKDEFLSIAGHELRTPMTAIKSYLWMIINKRMSEDDCMSDKTKRYLERAYQSTERLIALVNDMLDVSRIESGRVELHPEAFQVENLINEVNEEVAAGAIESKLKISLKFDQNTPQVFADRNKTHQVLLNLVGNAMKFTPPGGEITIGTKEDGEFVSIFVSDTGRGIAKSDLSKLFSKFGRLEGSYTSIATTKGTGLGLYICKRYITMMKGEITVESTQNKGTTFTFTLPVNK